MNEDVGDAISFNAQRNPKQTAPVLAQGGRLIGTQELFRSNGEASSESSTLTCGSDAFWFNKYKDRNLVPHHQTRGSYTPKKETTSQSWQARTKNCQASIKIGCSAISRASLFLQNREAEEKEGSTQPRLTGVMLLVESLPRVIGSAHRD
jgi:hypothetical protein